MRREANAGRVTWRRRCSAERGSWPRPAGSMARRWCRGRAAGEPGRAGPSAGLAYVDMPGDAAQCSSPGRAASRAG